jgi:hypothetical protein
MRRKALPLIHRTKKNLNDEEMPQTKSSAGKPGDEDESEEEEKPVRKVRTLYLSLSLCFQYSSLVRIVNTVS